MRLKYDLDGKKKHYFNKLFSRPPFHVSVLVELKLNLPKII